MACKEKYKRIYYVSGGTVRSTMEASMLLLKITMRAKGIEPRRTFENIGRGKKK